MAWCRDYKLKIVKVLEEDPLTNVLLTPSEKLIIEDRTEKKLTFTDYYLEVYAVAQMLTSQIHLTVLDDNDIPKDRFIMCKQFNDIIPIVIQRFSCDSQDVQC